MATYSFRCEACGREEDIRRSIQEGPPQTILCECGGQMARVYKIEKHIPRMTFKPWDTFYHTKIEPRLNEVISRERKRLTRKKTKGHRTKITEGVIK